LQKRPIILRSLLIVATPYQDAHTLFHNHTHNLSLSPFLTHTLSASYAIYITRIFADTKRERQIHTRTRTHAHQTHSISLSRTHTCMECKFLDLHCSYICRYQHTHTHTLTHTHTYTLASLSATLSLSLSISLSPPPSFSLSLACARAWFARSSIYFARIFAGTNTHTLSFSLSLSLSLFFCLSPPLFLLLSLSWSLSLSLSPPHTHTHMECKPLIHSARIFAGTNTHIHTRTNAYTFSHSQRARALYLSPPHARMERKHRTTVLTSIRTYSQVYHQPFFGFASVFDVFLPSVSRQTESGKYL